MSKKYKDSTCVYCCAAKSATADHVFARQLLLAPRRANTPKVPACSACNQAKSRLEHYLAALLPFGGRHTDASLTLGTMVPRRLAANRALHEHLRKGVSRVWTREGKLRVPALALPLDWNKVERWVEFLVRGLAWHHWRLLVGPDCEIKVVGLTQQLEKYFARLTSLRAAKRVSVDLGASALSYEAVQGTDNPQISVWVFSIYGGMKFMAGGGTARHEISRIGVLVGPRHVSARAEQKARWLRGQGISRSVGQL